MSRYDYLIRGTALDDQVRFFAVDSTTVVQTTLQRHQLSPASTLLLGRLLTSALLMGADLKSDAASLTLNIEAEGELQGAMAVYEPRGKVKGYAKNPGFFAPIIRDNWEVGKLLGKGTLSVIRDLQLKAPQIGTTALVTGEVGEDIAAYYLNSEQVPTAISVGVLFNAEGVVQAAGGYLIQQMPNADPERVEALRQNLANTPYITDLLDMGADLEKILTQFIFKDLEWTKHDLYPVFFQCSCSRERFTDALRLLGKAELETMAEGIAPVCNYCNEIYEFTSDDLALIISALD